MNFATGIINLYCTLIGIILLSTAIDKLYRNHLGMASRYYVAALFSGTVMTLCNGLSFLLPQYQQSLIVNTLNILTIISFYSVLVFYCRYVICYVQDAHQPVNMLVFYAVIVIAFASILLWNGTIIRPFIYDFHRQRYVSTLMFWVGSLPGLVIELLIIGFLLVHRKAISASTTFWFILLLIFPWLSSLIDLYYPGLNMKAPFMMISMLGVYVIIHVGQDRKIQEQQDIILQERLKLTIERIKPHYIYNVLSSIYYLCDDDPKKAQSAIGLFADYLRSTFSTLDRNENVSFEWELNLVRNYISLEQMRFPKPFHVSYQVEATSFLLPPLSLQVLVENAIKHGLKDRDHAGEIQIRSFEREQDFCIQVKDNGIGFDTQKFFQNHNDTALSNVRDRLAILCRGTMVITSIPNTGTTVELFIPKDKANMT